MSRGRIVFYVVVATYALLEITGLMSRFMYPLHDFISPPFLVLFLVMFFYSLTRDLGECTKKNSRYRGFFKPNHPV